MLLYMLFNILNLNLL